MTHHICDECSAHLFMDVVNYEEFCWECHGNGCGRNRAAAARWGAARRKLRQMGIKPSPTHREYRRSLKVAKS
jgi:hypothetical protein